MGERDGIPIDRPVDFCWVRVCVCLCVCVCERERECESGCASECEGAGE